MLHCFNPARCGASGPVEYVATLLRAWRICIRHRMVRFRSRLPPSWGAAGLFLVSFLLGALVVGAFCMLIYISAFFTISPMGVRLVAVAVVDFFSGAIIPLPFFPEKLQVIFSLLPFGSMQNVPYRIYGGDLAGLPALVSILIQAFWLLALLLLGRLMMRKALQRVVIQGG